MTAATSSSLGALGRYELLARLGAGGMGEVFLARATGTAGFETRLVIKKMLPHLAASPEFVQRFIEEGKLVAQLRHAGIVQVLDLCTTGGDGAGDLYLVMEHVDGRDLRHLLRLSRGRGESPPVEIAVAILGRLLEALDYAHRLTGPDGRPLGLIHRDVTPSNVLLSRSGDVKLGDFGIARAGGPASSAALGGPEGKVSYMSPQQAAGAALDARSDQFSVGVVAWELLVGWRPFDGPTDTETLANVQACRPGSIADAAPGLAPEVAAVVDRLLARDPEERFPTADDARRALQQWLGRAGATVSARDIAAWVEGLLADAPAASDGALVPLSVDDLLRLGMRENAGSTATHTATPLPDLDPAPSPVKRTLTPSRPPSLAALDLPDAPSSPLGARTEVPPSRRRRGSLLALLVAANLLLLGSVAFLLFGDSARPRAQTTATPDVAVVADLPAAPVVEAPAPQPEPPTLAEPVGLAPEPEPERPEPTPVAPTTAGRATGLALANVGARLDAAPVSLTVRATPPNAQVTIAGFGTASAPRTVEVRRGAELTVSARLEGYASRQTTVTVDGDETVHLSLKAEARGQVRFRFFPASAEVRIDDRAVATGGRNLVELELPVGAHRLELVGPTGERRAVPFRVTEGKVTNLATVQLGSASGEAPGGEARP